jgi:hypothetical protein
MKHYGSTTTSAEPQTDTSLNKSIFAADATNKFCSSNRLVYKYAGALNNGILINGTVMFPLFNNAFYPSPIAGELSASDYHFGQRDGGPHCHSDAYQSGQNLETYNDADCSGKTYLLLISAFLAAPNSASTNIWVEQ